MKCILGWVMHGKQGSYMCATHALQLESSDDVGGQLLGVRQGHTHDSVGLCTAGWPILVTLDPGPLLQAGQHHNSAASLLPNHPPEICKCFRKGTLKKINFVSKNIIPNQTRKVQLK